MKEYLPHYVDDPARQCGSKRAYTKPEAKKAAKTFAMHRGGEKIRPYRCPHCERWHLGHRR